MASFGVIIPAAGCGERFGSDKLMYDLCGKPVLWHTVASFQLAETVKAIVISTRNDAIETVRALTAEFPKVVAVVEGGKTRKESVFNALSVLSEDLDYLSIHDGARPLIVPSEIDRIHRLAEQFGSVCAGLPVVDTIQQVDDWGYIESTPPRASLIAAATPQVFPRSVYLSACRQTTGMDFTDDAGLVHAVGGQVKMVLCQCENFKITTREDGMRAQAVLASRS